MQWIEGTWLGCRLELTHRSQGTVVNSRVPCVMRPRNGCVLTRTQRQIVRALMPYATQCIEILARRAALPGLELENAL